MPLLRTSNFCKHRTQRQQNHHHRHQNNVHPPQRLPIRLHTTSNHSNYENNVSVGYAPTQVFIALSIQEASLVLVCCRCNIDKDEDDDDIKRVLIRLKLAAAKDDADLEENQINFNNNERSSWLRVSPVVATNLGLGLHRFCDDDDPNAPKKGRCCWIETTFQKPVNARRVVLRPLGRRPTESWQKKLLLSVKEEESEEEKWLFPPPTTLLQPLTIVSAYDKTSQITSYYDILEAIPENNNDIDDNMAANDNHSGGKSSLTQFFEIRSSTDIVLDRAPWINPLVRRLPPQYEPYFVQQTNLNDSKKNNDSNKEQQQQQQSLPKQQLVLPPHPNIPELTRWLQHISPSSSGETVLHAIGNDRDHHIRVAVETAAHLAGMQCLSIRGLAAFAHNSFVANQHESENSNNTGGGGIRTGSIQDQLAGLEAAIKYIRRNCMEPCVLHIYDFDTELSSIDEPTRHDQEERFWSMWMRLTTKTTKMVSRSLPEVSNDVQATEETDISNSSVWAPSLCLVLSTLSPLKSGPLMEKLIFPSVELSLPDLDYTKHLWEDGGLSWNDELTGILPCRSAQEILQLRRKAVRLHGDNSLSTSLGDATQTEKSITKFLREQCTELDEGRRKSSSNLSQISNVQWDDVGGLAHVRTEIMDAIELPLQHPHLFPKSGGRSGILLYGPPGTGKTLVAKAVATECRLPFLSVKGPELLGSYVGESEANIRNVFASARDSALKNAPASACILFFDELDSLAPRRGGVGDGGGVMERVVATLLSELDASGDVDSGRVFVMGATNRPDLLDPSLLRSGRFDRLVYLGIPTDANERARVLAAQIRKLRLEGGNAENLARSVVQTLPARLTGADMSTIASGALLNAVHRLCRRADKEQQIIQDREGKHVSIEDIIEDWDENDKTPTVCLEDLQAAAKDVSPSVTESELLRYERLRDEFSGNTSGERRVEDAVEHDGDVFYG